MSTFLKAAVIGFPAQHSLSPLIHNDWIARYGLAGTYEAIDVHPDALNDAVFAMVDEGFAGFNVTMPLKQDVMDLCDVVDETARKIGAVNTVAIGEDGALRGMNTDWFGFAESVAEAVPEFSFEGGARNALVLGAGGAARGVIYGLQQMGAGKIYIANRTREKADELAGLFGVEAVDWGQREEAAGNAALLVNTTAAGMMGQPDLAFDVAALKKTAVVCDIISKPRRTYLLERAATRGLRVVEGLGMLLHQARPAFAAWTGIMPDVTDELREKVAGAAGL